MFKLSHWNEKLQRYILSQEDCIEKAMSCANLSLPTSSLWEAAAANANLLLPSSAVNLYLKHKKDKQQE